jgi:hypothetical protein
VDKRSSLLLQGENYTEAFVTIGEIPQKEKLKDILS